jgi:hypothetical protein
MKAGPSPATPGTLVFSSRSLRTGMEPMTTLTFTSWMPTFRRGPGVRLDDRGSGRHASPEAFLVDVDTAIIRAAGSVTHPRQLRPISTADLRDFCAKGS